MDNAFLRNFLKAREAQTTSEKKKSADSDKTTIGLPESASGGITLATIIEDCPPKSKVLEYLRRRIDELEADDD